MMNEERGRRSSSSFNIPHSTFIIPDSPFASMRRALLLFTAVALLYCGAGLIPGRVLAPVDLVADTGAWKGDLASRVRVSNSLLSDVVAQFMAWDAEVLRLLGAGRGAVR